MFSFEEKILYQTAIKQIKLQSHRLIKHLKPQDSSFSSSKEVNTKPITNNISETMADAKDKLKSIFPFTTGCIIANTIIAIPKFIKPFPSSLKPFDHFIQNIITLKEV